MDNDRSDRPVLKSKTSDLTLCDFAFLPTLKGKLKKSITLTWLNEDRNQPKLFVLIIHPFILFNQSVPVAPGDFKIKSHIRTAARHTSLLTK